MSLTRTGADRERYAKEVEPRPARWTPREDGGYDANPAHVSWVERADRWALEDAARASIAIPLDRASGRHGTRHQDPLRRLIPGDGGAEERIVRLVELITGEIPHKSPVNLAPACRAALRRWAVRG